MANGQKTAPKEYVQLIFAEYLSQYKNKFYGFAKLADEVAAKLDKKCLGEAIVSLYENAKPESIQLTFIPLVFRYADGKTVEKLYRKYKAVKWTEAVANQALVLNDTREALLLADKHKLLFRYAFIRGTTEDYYEDKMLYHFGFDENGKKVYDLGTKTIELSLNSDLTLGLYDVSKGKVVKSIPKKEVDLELYTSANADYTDIKKNIKKAAKNKNKRLFEDFLDGSKLDAEKWKEVYLVNPLLRQIANLLVWEQKGKTFTLFGKNAIDAHGKDYVISNNAIRLAYPTEMKAEDITAWQKYFTSHGLKQPFEQIWEPVIDASSIKADRYKGCMIPYYRFWGQEKHGIFVTDYNYHAEIEIGFKDCEATVDRIDWRSHEIDVNDNFEVSLFSFKHYTRWVNHIVAYLDKVTIYGKILKDDISITELLPRFTLAQITDFMKAATENNCTNVTAVLLDYKNSTFSDFDPMEEFSLEL